MEREHNSIRAALGEALARDETPEAPKQGDFGFAEPALAARLTGADDDVRIADLLGLPKVAEKRALVIAENNAGKGRPRGQHNRKTQAWIEHLLRRYPSPLETLAQIQASPIDALAAELHCTRLEALIQKRHAAEALAPFIHQKLSSIEILPAGVPGGDAAPLVLVPQPDVPVYKTIDAVIVETAGAAIDEPPCATGTEEAANTDAALLAKSDVAGPSSSTLRLQPQEPIEQVVEASVADAGDHVDAAVARALDALAELMRGDPEQARQIRAQMAAILG